MEKGCSLYVGWEEVYVNGEKGRREVHYCLKRRNGKGIDVAVIGKEKSLRHMSYRVVLDLGVSNFMVTTTKLRSRREVVDWLHSLIPDSCTPVSPQMSNESYEESDASEFDVELMKDTQLRKLGQFTKEFLWLGSPSTCKKRRKHYQAFRRNGIKISVNEFVYVLAEEDKRLVAYLDDMYEDAKGNKLVVVRWFHKIDEVGIDLPHNYNDREIFFSLCLQDLSIECIDGLATVLSPLHYSKFLKEARHTQLEPFVCHRQYDNEDLKPLDITQVKGYWKQEILRYMFSLSSSRASEKSCQPNDFQKKADTDDVGLAKPRKRLRLARDCNILCSDQINNDVIKSGSAQGPVAAASVKDVNVKVCLCTAVGSQVEVLSQDSGMRGCWFRAVVIKKHKNKVKLRYSDIKDADDETNCLEEWVLGSRIAARDETGLRIYGRTTIRPLSLSDDNKVSRVIDVGTIVDVWWHDGWWEGIVIKRESDEKLQVYFPGEKRVSIFARNDLRYSQEWISSTWKQLKGRPDLAASILASLETFGSAAQTNDEAPPNETQCDPVLEKHQITPVSPYGSTVLLSDPAHEKANKSALIDLSKDDFLSQLKWSSCRKRKRITPLVQRPHARAFWDPTTLNVEKEKCKYISDSLFSSPVSPLTSLVMSR